MFFIIQVSYNKITSIGTLPSELFTGLKVLNLEGNPIENWEDVDNLGQLPK